MDEHGATSFQSPPPLLYRAFRGFFRFITSIWFREINVIDDEYIADEAGVLFLTWHPNGLIDPMLMTARLPGKLSTLVHHRLFRLPFVGWVFRKAGVVPFGMKGKRSVNLGLGPSTSDILDDMAEELANGGQVLMFPEETTHDRATVQRVRSGAARILLSASRLADAAGKPRPRVVP
ncbi:MAG: 1-acyl-sn-glycerol-3-phosphate acyltransferase, partial [Flavobacteriales bacterium]|nr:1-acyl-sn-glycerol-3-phosphate acyltransferase [Flavobacteriales bacterium]